VELTGFASWQAFYQSDLQSVWALLPVPALFLVGLFASGRLGRAATPRERFVGRWAVVFAVLTLVDPIATGPGARWLELSDAAKTGVMLLFVLLGDFRVFALVFGLAGGAREVPAALGRAARWTAIVPLTAWASNALLELAVPGLPDQSLWLIYELAFAALALHLRRRFRSDRLLRAASTYVAVYYALWASADVLILSGLDTGWLLRVVPNQLYYAFWVPFVYVANVRIQPGPVGPGESNGSDGSDGSDGSRR
jgi:hypothetical protein